jgi:hypothetical protein
MLTIPKSVSIVGVVTSLLLGTAVLGFGQNPAPMPKRDPERHPHIRAAMADLRKAANQLEHADHDFGGHRAKAVALVKQAEDELREAIAWAKAHPDSDKAPSAAAVPKK